MGRIIAVVNQKGGVGKTTTAVNLAASLGAAEKKTLLIDIDPQANATSAVGVSPFELGDRQTYQLILGQKNFDEIVRATDVPNLWLIPAAADLIGFEIEGINLVGREGRLREVLLPIKDRFDVILIDCPPSLGLLTLNALTAADGVLVPLQAEYFALEGLGRLMQTVDLIRTRIHPGLELDGIVLTMFDRRNNLAHQVAKEVEEHFPEKLWCSRIPRNVRLSEAPSFGKPILLYDIRSPGAQAYLALAQEFLERSTVVEKGGTNERTEESTGPGVVVADPQPRTDHV